MDLQADEDYSDRIGAKRRNRVIPKLADFSDAVDGANQSEPNWRRLEKTLAIVGVDGWERRQAFYCRAPIFADMIVMLIRCQ